MLKVSSIFLSVDGECAVGGPLQWSVFVRLHGCNLRCWKDSGFCDTLHAVDPDAPFQELWVDEVVEMVQAFCPCERVTITGGEPLVQKAEVLELVRALHLDHHPISLETNGSFCLVPVEVALFDCVIMDLKLPSSKMTDHMSPSAFTALREYDYIKCVISDRKDYLWALDFLERVPASAKVAFGPKYGVIEPRQILAWLQEDKLFHIRLNMQLHKYIWPEVVMDTDYRHLINGER